MSLDMTIGTRVTAAHTGILAETEAAPPMPFWAQDMIAIMGTGVCAVLASALAVLLYLA